MKSRVSADLVQTENCCENSKNDLDGPILNRKIGKTANLTLNYHQGVKELYALQILLQQQAVYSQQMCGNGRKPTGSRKDREGMCFAI